MEPPIPGPPARAIAGRSIWVVALFVAHVAVVLIGVGGLASFFVRPTPGVVFFDDFNGVTRAVLVGAATMEAEQAIRGPGLAPLVAVNGRRVATLPAGRPPAVSALELCDEREGAVNVVVIDQGDGPRALRLHAGRPDLAASPFLWLATAFQALGVAFAVIGWVVWWRRPGDPSAVALLVFCAVASLQMSFGVPTSAFGHSWSHTTSAATALYGPAALGLAIAFTSHPLGRKLHIALRGAWGLAAALFVVGLVGSERGITDDRSQLVQRTVVLLAGALLVACVIGLAVVCFRMARGARPPRVKMRARFFGILSIASFLVPSVLTAVPVDTNTKADGWISLGLGSVTLVCLALFPAALGWAIVRHRLFDLRIVLRKSLVFVALSAVVSLAYVGLVLAAVRVMGTQAQSPAFLGVGSAIAILAFTFLQLRVQRFVDRRVYASRYVYAGAVEAASEAIARARTLDDAVQSAREALLGAMRLSRGWVVYREREGDVALRCVALAGEASSLESSVDPEAHAPLASALTERRWISAYEADREAGPGEEARADAFFETHGIEAIVPFGATRSVTADRSPQTPSSGALLLGPRADRRPIDDEDLALLYTVANQLSVGIENALALAEIRRLKDGLEEEVAERTRDLRLALDELAATQGQLVESEKQATLGRLVAGIVHEINTPLGVVMSSSDTLRRALGQATAKLDAALDEATKDALRRTLASSTKLTELQSSGGRRISDVVTSLSHLVALDRGEVVEHDVRVGIDSVVSLVAHGVEGRIRIERSYPDVLPRVECAPERLNQVFLALVSNAIAAISGEGRIDIVVSARDGRVIVEVKDTGRGIPKDAIAELFEFGFAKKDGRVGLRLGLPTSKQAVTALGGDIDVTSEEGRGTTVRVSVPVRA